MYLRWWKIQNIYTKWDLALGAVALTPIVFVILYTFSAYPSPWVVYLERIVNSGPVLASGSVPFLVWQWYRNGLKKQVKYCHKSGIQPLYNALYIDSLDSRVHLRRSSIFSRLRGTYFTAGEYFSIRHFGENMEKDLQWRYQADENWKDLREASEVVRRYRALYSRATIKTIDELPKVLVNYDEQLYQLALQIRNKAAALNIPEDWWDALEHYARGKLNFQSETQLKEHAVAADHVVSEVQAQAGNVKHAQEYATGVLGKLRSNLRHYMIAMTLEVPKEPAYLERETSIIET